MSSSQERKKLIENTQKKVMEQSKGQFRKTETFIKELNKQISLSLIELEQKANKLMARPEFQDDKGLQFRVEKIQLLMENINKMCVNIGNVAQENILSHLMKSYTQQYMKNTEILGDMIGIHSTFAQPNEVAVIQAINYPWSGKMWSERVWNNTSQLNTDLKGIIQRGMITGKSVQDMAKEISRDLVRRREQYKYATERIIRTETARVQYIADTKVWEDYEVKKVKYLAFLDGRTSDICRERDGKIYELGKEPKLPAHPHCRSCYVPVVDIEDTMAQIRKRQQEYKESLRKEGILNTPIGKNDDYKIVQDIKKTVKPLDVEFKKGLDLDDKPYVELFGERVRSSKTVEKYLKDLEGAKSLKDIDNLRLKIYEDDVPYSDYEALNKLASMVGDNIRLSEYGHRYAFSRSMAKELGENLNSLNINALDEGELLAVKQYTGVYSSDMNFHFRQGKEVDDYVKKLIKDLDNAISKNVVQEDIMAFRGASWGALDSNLQNILMGDEYKNAIGSVIIDKGFMSTSIGKNSAFEGKGVSYEIKIPKGTNGLYVDDISVCKGEMELILPRDIPLKVVDVFRDEESYNVKLVLEVAK